MDEIIDRRFERVEKALATLITSISTYNPAPALANDLVNADAELSQGLEQRMFTPSNPPIVTNPLAQYQPINPTTQRSSPSKPHPKTSTPKSKKPSPSSPARAAPCSPRPQPPSHHPQTQFLTLSSSPTRAASANSPYLVPTGRQNKILAQKGQEKQQAQTHLGKASQGHKQMGPQPPSLE